MRAKDAGKYWRTWKNEKNRELDSNAEDERKREGNSLEIQQISFPSPDILSLTINFFIPILERRLHELLPPSRSIPRRCSFSPCDSTPGEKDEEVEDEENRTAEEIAGKRTARKCCYFVAQAED